MRISQHTPKTDAFAKEHDEYSPDVDRYSAAINFARELEMELEELKRELARVERLYEKKTAERDGEYHQRP